MYDRIHRSKNAVLALEEEGAIGPRSRLVAVAQHQAAQREWEAEAERIEGVLVEAVERDALQRVRPEGCTCPGLGGRGTMFLAGGMRVWSSPCVCPEGVASREAGERVRAEWAARAEAEQEARRRAAAARELEERLAYANIPPRFLDLDFATFPHERSKQGAVGRLTAFGEPTPPTRGLYLFGHFGTGKTGLSIAALKAWLAAGRWGLFVTVPALLDGLRPGGEGRLGVLSRGRDVLDRVATTPLLVLDDLGAERMTQWGRERLFLIVNHRHDHDLPTIFTSNYSADEVGQRLAGDDDLREGQRLVWRIVEVCDVVELKGRNLRAPRGGQGE